MGYTHYWRLRSFSETPAAPEMIKVVAWPNVSWINICQIVSEKLLRAAILPTEALVIIGEILERTYARGIIQREHDDPRAPFVSDTKIRFNGVGENGHETFYFTSTPETGQSNTDWTFHFCKTNRKPYDRVVIQVLIVLKYYLGKAITVTSDGDFTVEWATARRELEHRYGIRTVSGQQLERAAA